MSNEPVEYSLGELLSNTRTENVNQSEEDRIWLSDDNAIDLGQCWAAINNKQVIATLPMRTPTDIEFSEYREKAKACLSLLGDVKAGVKMQTDNVRYFKQRLTHVNRGKKPRMPKIYILNEDI